MEVLCQGKSCRITSKMRTVLFLAGIYHLAFALWAILWPSSAFELLQLQEPHHLLLWRVLGLLSGLLGTGLIIAAKGPIRQ